MSTETASEWNLDGLGVFGEPHEFEVTRERVIAYAEATNDEHPRHVSGELAPPVFAIVPVMECLMPSIGSLVPGEVLMTVVHGEQDIRFHQPIVPGQTLVSRAAPVGVHGRSSGVQVVAKATTETAAGELVVEQYMTAFFRGAQLDLSEGEPLTEHAFPEELRTVDPLAAVTQGYDADTTQRYSVAAGDPMPIHLDDDFAKAMGLPGIIVHGLCTMAYTSRAVIQTACPEDPSRLQRLAVRFAKVVQPSEKVTTSIWDAGNGRYAFETVSGAPTAQPLVGNVAIKDGLAEVR
jgi:acyl dehydratase